MKYVIHYEYSTWPVCGWDCCHDSSSEIHIYEEHRFDEGVYTSHLQYVELIQDEKELREYIRDNHPEFNNFDVHPSTRYF